MCLGFISSYGSFVAVRALLGIAEGGLLPGMVSGLSKCDTICANNECKGSISVIILQTLRSCSPNWSVLYCSVSVRRFWWIVG
jgi:hypothetical protein